MSRVVALPESSAKLVALLAKVPHFDKDERYMAVLGEPRDLASLITTHPLVLHSVLATLRQTSKRNS